MNVKDAMSIVNNIVNPTDADKLRAYIYDLQTENIDLKSQFEECKTKLHIHEEWLNTKSLYEQHKTDHGSIVYVKIEESLTDVFYCPVCFDKKSIIPLQKIFKSSPGLKYSWEIIKKCPSCEQTYVF